MFVSADSIVPSPYNPQTLNRYSYCFNNPLIYTDPSGHDPHGMTHEEADARGGLDSIDSNGNVYELETIVVTATRLEDDHLGGSEGVALAGMVGVNALKYVPEIAIGLPTLPGWLWGVPLAAVGFGITPSSVAEGTLPADFNDEKAEEALDVKPEPKPEEDTPVKPSYTGKPGSTVQGKKQSRTYGEDGKPKTDRDFPHPGGPEQERKDHSHDWGPDGRGPARDPKPGDPPQPKGF